MYISEMRADTRRVAELCGSQPVRPSPMQVACACASLIGRISNILELEGDVLETSCTSYGTVHTLPRSLKRVTAQYLAALQEIDSRQSWRGQETPSSSYVTAQLRLTRRIVSCTIELREEFPNNCEAPCPKYVPLLRERKQGFGTAIIGEEAVELTRRSVRSYTFPCSDGRRIEMRNRKIAVRWL